MNTNYSVDSVIYLSSDLPATCMELDQWCIVRVTGSDKKKYLNSQFTIDMNLIHNNEYKIGAHCNINGKVWTSFLIFSYINCYFYIIRSEIFKKHITELKKYSLFSKVNITKEKNFRLFGLCGFNTKGLLQNIFTINFSNKKNILIFKNLIILKFNFIFERFLILVPQTESIDFLNSIKRSFKFSNSIQWSSLDIEEGFPILGMKTSGRFILQTLNLKKWNAISFNKGCYYGQEFLCKFENKQLNKFIICSLIGNNSSLHIPRICEHVQYTDKFNFKYNIGIVLSWTHVYPKKTLLQVRMKKIFFNKQHIFSILSCPELFFKIYHI
ncbi:tRNA-modifying protein YgfZ [Buchnera aphidicola]|uniref:tRNA-modifying protein YgfZ n=1 Tax=Buchnera aphidicola (Cinara strobi) TaxID=1921549 RepID=A0A3B1DLX5_9GAMM|nr:tRNA-modifying protein YgfZ [Buchnera aphidicola]VAX76691.1 tRNA-modifying protein YgfZ [Buchnera aphidicola (Cinara strobi)]